MDRVTARAFFRMWAGDVGLFVQRDDGGNRQVFYRGEWRDLDQGLLQDEPSFAVELDDAQKLIDDLWAAGVRPSETRDRDAQGRHLADMRAIAFGKLNIEKP